MFQMRLIRASVTKDNFIVAKKDVLLALQREKIAALLICMAKVLLRLDCT